MRELKDIIDLNKAPITQWSPVIGEEPSEGKLKEDALTHGAIIKELMNLPAHNVTNIISDEDRLVTRIAQYVPHTEKVTHLTLGGDFEKAAEQPLLDKNLELLAKTFALALGGIIHSPTEPVYDALTKSAQDLTKELKQQSAINNKITVTTDVDSIPAGTQDIVVMNMILGCLSDGTPEGNKNLGNILKMSAELLKPPSDVSYGGKLILVRPNPAGGAFSTYKTTTAPQDLKAGANYAFMVNGLEDIGEMCNLYTPDEFLEPLLDDAGFVIGTTKRIEDDPKRDNAPFLLNVYSLKLPAP